MFLYWGEVVISSGGTLVLHPKDSWVSSSPPQPLLMESWPVVYTINNKNEDVNDDGLQDAHLLRVFYVQLSFMYLISTYLQILSIKIFFVINCKN